MCQLLLEMVGQVHPYGTRLGLTILPLFVQNLLDAPCDHLGLMG